MTDDAGTASSSSNSLLQEEKAHGKSQENTLTMYCISYMKANGKGEEVIIIYHDASM